MKIILTYNEFSAFTETTFLTVDLLKRFGLDVPAKTIEECGNAEELADFLAKEDSVLLAFDSNDRLTHLEFIVDENEFITGSKVYAMLLKHLDDDVIVSSVMTVYHGAKMLLSVFKTKANLFKEEVKAFLKEEKEKIKSYDKSKVSPSVTYLDMLSKPDAKILDWLVTQTPVDDVDGIYNTSSQILVDAESMTIGNWENKYPELYELLLDRLRDISRSNDIPDKASDSIVKRYASCGPSLWLDFLRTVPTNDFNRFRLGRSLPELK